ncbi:hypothetical protein BGX27_007269, partial [Mortierella sp. AM989]
MAQEPRYQIPPAVEAITQRFGYNVLWLPPCHPDLNPGYMAIESDGNSFVVVKEPTYKGLEKAAPSWEKLVRRAIDNERRYIVEDRIRLNESPGSSLLFDVDTEDEDEDVEEFDLE